MGQATQLSEVQLARRVPRGQAGSRAGLWFAKASCRDSGPHLCRGRALLSDVEARQLVDWPHAPGRALCSHGNSTLLAGGTEASRSPRVWPSHPPVLQLGQPHGHGSVLCGGCLAQGVRHAVGGELSGCPPESTMSWAAEPRVGAGDKMARALPGSVCRGRVCWDPQIEAQLICRQVPFGRSGGLAFFSETDPQCPRPWGSYPLGNWPDPLALKQPLVTVGPSSRHRSGGAVGLPGGP